MRKVVKPTTNILAMLMLMAFGLLLFTANLFFGSVFIGFKDVTAILFSSGLNVDPGLAVIVQSFRLPQAVVAMMAGAGLAVAGLLMQTLFRNPLADPSILGISSGASLGVALLLFLTGSFTGMAVIQYDWWISLGVGFAAFLGALLVLMLILFMSTHVRNIVSLLIIGIMIAYVAGSLTGLLKYYSRKEDVQAFVIWGMGTFSNVGKSQLPYFVGSILLGLGLSFLLAKSLNMILLGDRYAENLGLNVKKTSFLVILLSGYLTAVITAYTGPIAFIGLAVPHLSRNLFKTSDHRILIPASILTGISLSLFCNLIARLPGFDGNLPINSITSLIGAPFVIWIIVHRHQYTKG